MLVGDDKIINELAWEDMQAETFCKTLTQILYEDDKPIAWGFSAPLQMARIAEKAEIDGVELPPGKYVFPPLFHLTSH
jgi:hypothetical protein